MTVRSILAMGFAATALVAASASASASAQPSTHPAQITFHADTLYPETASWSASQHAFFVSSVRHGTVGKLTLEGKYTPFIKDDKLVSSVGVLADDAHNTLWVCISDPGVGDRSSKTTQDKLAAVATYNETTGARRAYYPLDTLSQGAHFANDVTLDDKGDAYVTDSFSPIIYKISADGKMSVFAKNALFGAGNGFNLNGIAWFPDHQDGFLIVGRYNTGDLFRVSVADPTKVSKVRLPEALKGADGFHALDARHMIVAQNLGVDRTLELVSDDGWKSAKIVKQLKSAMSMPTSATQVGNDIYVLDSRLDTLFDPKATKVSDFMLQRFPRR